MILFFDMWGKKHTAISVSYIVDDDYDAQDEHERSTHEPDNNPGDGIFAQRLVVISVYFLFGSL